MSEVKLTAHTGRQDGSRASRRLLAEGQIPGVVYGLGADPVSVAVDRRELRTALTTDAGLNALLDLEVNGDIQLAVVKDIQRHPVKRDVTHIDFLRVDADATIDVEVPIHMTGEAEAVTNEDGIVELRLNSVIVNVKPADIPDGFTVDITDMTLDKTITVADLELPSGVALVTDEDQVVVSAEITRAALVEEDEEAAEGEEGEEGAEGEGDEGEASDEASGDDE